LLIHKVIARLYKVNRPLGGLQSAQYMYKLHYTAASFLFNIGFFCIWCHEDTYTHTYVEGLSWYELRQTIAYHHTSIHILQTGFVQPGDYGTSLYYFFKVLETYARHTVHAFVCVCVCVCVRACELYVMMLLISETAGRNEQLIDE